MLLKLDVKIRKGKCQWHLQVLFLQGNYVLTFTQDSPGRTGLPYNGGSNSYGAKSFPVF